MPRVRTPCWWQSKTLFHCCKTLEMSCSKNTQSILIKYACYEHTVTFYGHTAQTYLDVLRMSLTISAHIWSVLWWSCQRHLAWPRGMPHGHEHCPTAIVATTQGHGPWATRQEPSLVNKAKHITQNMKLPNENIATTTDIAIRNRRVTSNPTQLYFSSILSGFLNGFWCCVCCPFCKLMLLAFGVTLRSLHSSSTCVRFFVFLSFFAAR